MHQTPTQAISRTAALLAVALAATGLAAVPAASAPATRVVVTSLTGDVAAAARAVQSVGGKTFDPWKQPTAVFVHVDEHARATIAIAPARPRVQAWRRSG